jgi:phosphonate transport system substrate-binding protein
VKRIIAMSLVLILVLSSLVACGQAGDPEKLVVGFVPSQEAENLQAKTEPLAQLLTAELGMPVEVFVATNFNGLVEAMGAGKVDVGFLNPLGYVLASKKESAEVILKAVRRGADSYRAQFITRPDTGITKVEDLKGKKIAYVDPASTSGYLYPAAMMKNLGIDPQADVQYIFAGGHDKAVLAVLRGDVDAAVSFEDAREIVSKDNPDIMDKVIQFAFTDSIPNDTVSVRPGLSDDLKQRITDAFMNIAKDEQGAAIIKDIYTHDGYAPAQDSDFDIVRDVAETMGLDLEKEGK